MFNDKQLLEQTKSGVLRTVLMKEKHPSPEPAGEPFCTRSQMISYVDTEGLEIARVHQYLRPDGTVGGSVWRNDLSRSMTDALMPSQLASGA